MIKRVPIKINRKSIKFTKEMKLQFKLMEMSEITKDDDIIEIADHYNMLVIEATNKSGHSVLKAKNPKESKNWIHFETVYEICRLKGWDAKSYLEGQFNRAKGWSKATYPFPNMLYSDNAIRHYINYLGDIKQKYKQDTQKRKKEIGKRTKDLRTQIIDGILNSVELIDKYIKNNPMDNLEQHKAVTIFNHWQYISPFYLWSVDWFHEVLKDLVGIRADKCREEFDRINKSPTMKRVIGETIPQVEKQFNLPSNIKL